MKRIILIAAFARIVLICLIGATAALLGLRGLDNWCAAQLGDHPAE